MSRPRKEITPDAVEAAAARNRNQAEIAAGLGLSRVWLLARMRLDPELRAAYERGRARRAARPAATPEAGGAGTAASAGPRLSVVEGIRAGARTYGKLMAVTGLPHAALVVEVERLMCAGRIYARTVGEERQHFLEGETPPRTPAVDVRASSEAFT